MTPEIETFLKTERIGVLCVAMEDGSTHAATVHYSHNPDSLALYVSTRASSKKCEPLSDGQSAKASFVIGFSEADMLTIQLNGTASRVTDPAELAEIHAIHYKKHPHAAQFKDSPGTAFIKFVPTWWRFSDYSGDKLRIVAS